jgi:hypothetical protein
MDSKKAFERWATVELLGQEGETFNDVVNRISKEAVSKQAPLSHWSFINLNWDEVLGPPEPLPPAPRYKWKDPETKNRIRRPRTNVSRETSRLESVVEPMLEEVVEPEIDIIPVNPAGDEGTPFVMTPGMKMALFTKRQEQRAMKILLGKEHDGKD